MSPPTPQCVGDSRIAYLKGCPTTPIWYADGRTCCGLHLGRTIRALIESGREEVTVRRIGDAR